jgi:hypothetical protein
MGLGKIVLEACQCLNERDYGTVKSAQDFLNNKSW